MKEKHNYPYHVSQGFSSAQGMQHVLKFVGNNVALPCPSSPASCGFKQI
jgi:hypothetical protein